MMGAVIFTFSLISHFQTLNLTHCKFSETCLENKTQHIHTISEHTHLRSSAEIKC